MPKNTTSTDNSTQSEEKNLNDSIFERCPHDRENPYVMINRDLTRNASLSFQARGFLLYLLAHADGWKINRQYIMKTQKIGKERLRSIVDELRKEGFLLMQSERLRNGTLSVKYLVSEYPRFKEISTKAGFPEPVEPHPVDPALKKEQSSKERTTKEPPTPPTGAKAFRIRKRKAWAEANQNNSPCGYSMALEDRYVIVTGQVTEEHFYAKRDSFWDDKCP